MRETLVGVAADALDIEEKLKIYPAEIDTYLNSIVRDLTVLGLAKNFLRGFAVISHAHLSSTLNILPNCGFRPFYSAYPTLKLFHHRYSSCLRKPNGTRLPTKSTWKRVYAENSAFRRRGDEVELRVKYLPGGISSCRYVQMPF